MVADALAPYTTPYISNDIIQCGNCLPQQWVSTIFDHSSSWQIVFLRQQSALPRVKIDGLVQERGNAIANALELHLSYINPSKWYTLLAAAHAWRSSPLIQGYSCSQKSLTWKYNDHIWVWEYVFMRNPSWQFVITGGTVGCHYNSVKLNSMHKYFL